MKGRKTEFDLNIVPIVDCLTILLTFMLASGAFISIGVLELGIASSSSAATTAGQKDGEPVHFRVEVYPDRSVVLQVSGQQRDYQKIEALDQKVSLTRLNSLLEGWKKRYNQVNSAMLLSHPEVDYKDVVQVLETIKRTHNEVALGSL